MTRLLRAEALRLATTRAYWLLAIGATALIVGGVAPTAAATNFTPRHQPRPLRPGHRRAGPDRRTARRRALGHRRVPAQDHHPRCADHPQPHPAAGREDHHPGRRRAGLRPRHDPQ
jgi:hypothetical protein